MGKLKYYKCQKDEHTIGIIVGEELENGNYKMLTQSVILGLPVNCMFYDKTSVERDEFEDIMKCLDLGICPKLEAPILFEEF